MEQINIWMSSQELVGGCCGGGGGVEAGVEGGVGGRGGGAGISGGSVDQLDPFTHHKETWVSLPWVLRLFGYLLLQYGEEDFF
jgi:hypothetical protein